MRRWAGERAVDVLATRGAWIVFGLYSRALALNLGAVLFVQVLYANGHEHDSAGCDGWIGGRWC